MKKLPLLLSVGSLCMLASCNSDNKSSGNNNAQGEKNLAAFHAINKAVESGDMSKIGDYIAADGIDHAGENGDVKGLDSIKAQLAMVHTMAKDMKTEIIKELADSEYAFVWERYTGNSDGNMGMPKGPYNVTTLHVAKFKDGKSTEHWEFMQPADVMKMMPPPAKDPEPKK